MQLHEARNLALQLMQEHNLHDWHFVFDDAKMRFGQCSHSEKTISLSTYLTEANSVNQVRNTILHEIAHALVGPRNGHNKVWKKKAIEIGCDGQRCYDINQVNVPTARYIAICPGCQRQWSRYKTPHKNLKNSCSFCSSKYDSKYQLKYQLNPNY